MTRASPRAEDGSPRARSGNRSRRGPSQPVATALPGRPDDGFTWIGRGSSVLAVARDDNNVIPESSLVAGRRGCCHGPDRSADAAEAGRSWPPKSGRRLVDLRCAVLDRVRPGHRPDDPLVDAPDGDGGTRSANPAFDGPAIGLCRKADEAHRERSAVTGSWTGGRPEAPSRRQTTAPLYIRPIAAREVISGGA